jgi:hypothetical protein
MTGWEPLAAALLEGDVLGREGEVVEDVLMTLQGGGCPAAGADDGRRWVRVEEAHAPRLQRRVGSILVIKDGPTMWWGMLLVWWWW